MRLKHTHNTFAGVALNYAKAIAASKSAKYRLQGAYLDWFQVNEVRGIHIGRGSEERAATDEYAALVKAQCHERRCKAKFLAEAKGCLMFLVSIFYFVECICAKKGGKK